MAAEEDGHGDDDGAVSMLGKGVRTALKDHEFT
jgi:hypothetical protein